MQVLDEGKMRTCANAGVEDGIGGAVRLKLGVQVFRRALPRSRNPQCMHQAHGSYLLFRRRERLAVSYCLAEEGPSRGS